MVAAASEISRHLRSRINLLRMRPSSRSTSACRRARSNSSCGEGDVIMTAKVATPDRQPKGKPGDLPLIGATPSRQLAVDDGQHAVNSVDPWFPSLVGACALRHLSHKDICYTLGGLDKGQVSRQFDGDGHLSAKRIGELPREVWLDIADGIRQHFGVGDPAAEKRALAEDAIKTLARFAMLACGDVPHIEGPRR